MVPRFRLLTLAALGHPQPAIPQWLRGRQLRRSRRGMTHVGAASRVPGGGILREVCDAYQGAYRDRIAAQDTRLLTIRFTAAADADPRWATGCEPRRSRPTRRSASRQPLARRRNRWFSPTAPPPPSWPPSSTGRTPTHAPPGSSSRPPPARLAHLLDTIAPAKGVDALGVDALTPACATADGITGIAAPFLESNIAVAVVGASGFVGSGVVDLGDDLRQVRDVDVLSTTGVAGLLTAEHIHPGHRLVVDSGFVPSTSGPVGDLAPEAAALPKIVTPVPGGIGPVEMAVLAERLVHARAAPGLASWTYRGLGARGAGPLTSAAADVAAHERHSTPRAAPDGGPRRRLGRPRRPEQSVRGRSRGSTPQVTVRGGAVASLEMVNVAAEAADKREVFPDRVDRSPVRDSVADQ
jgi:methylenetetrahydrofolate dehydrogenase (NADP+)/methenyltetrahydrofolate cyclohydrolase